MDYTREDVDRILEASKKATRGPWGIANATYLYGGGVGVYQQIAAFDNDDDWEEQQGSNRVLCSGAPILAEEVKRLRAEVKEWEDKWVDVCSC